MCTLPMKKDLSLSMLARRGVANNIAPVLAKSVTALGDIYSQEAARQKTIFAKHFE